jgi:Barstar (barnase inhibitor)
MGLFTSVKWFSKQILLYQKRSKMSYFIILNSAFKANNLSSYSVTIDGTKALVIENAYLEIAKAFKFPTYFNCNRDSFFTCLNDLEGLAQYEEYNLIIENYDYLLINEEKTELNYFLEDLKQTSTDWKNVPNYEGEAEFRHRSKFNVYIINTPKAIQDLINFNFPYKIQ